MHSFDNTMEVILLLFIVCCTHSQSAHLSRNTHFSRKQWNNQFEEYLTFRNSDFLWNYKDDSASDNTVNWVKSIDRQIHGHRVRRQTRGSLRREIRMLSWQERRRFFDALNALKVDTSIPPSLYESLVEYHRSFDTLRVVHNGSNFLSWHRIYCLRLEFALQQKDPTVTLPYWDSTIDAELDDPVLSILWTPEYFGNGFEDVVRGPFSNWTFDGAPLWRNIGFLGSLIRHNDLERLISSAQSHEDVVWMRNRIPPRPLELTIEGQHNNVHTWVGGTMDGLQIAPRDPVFFLHHCFIDLIWERVRRKIQDAGGNPETDYPDSGSREHAARNQMVHFEFMRNIDGYSNRWTDFYYQYEPQPSCSISDRVCPSEDLNCVESRYDRNSYVCTSITSNYVLDVSPKVRYRSALADLNKDIGPRFESTNTDRNNGLMKLLQNPAVISSSDARKLAIAVFTSGQNIRGLPSSVQRELISKVLSLQ